MVSLVLVFLSLPFLFSGANVISELCGVACGVCCRALAPFFLLNIMKQLSCVFERKKKDLTLTCVSNMLPNLY